MAGNLTAMIASIFSGSAVTADPYYEYTTLLLPGNGTNGAQNNTFLDGSTNNFTITRNGNTTQGTFSPFSQTGWGNYFDGSGDSLVPVSANTANAMGTGDWTFETWVYKIGTGQESIFDTLAASGGTTDAIRIRIDASASGGAILFFRYGAVVTSGGTVTLNTWNHIALVRQSGTLKIYLNGTQVNTTYNDSGVNYTCGASRPIIGIDGFGGTSNAFTGYISNLRTVKGVAVYTGAFTPPTLPLAATQSAGTNISAITGTQTSLLTCQSNRFIDNSTNNFTITPAGNTSVVAFSPFNPTASWSAATYGGSGYFDGNGDYLTVPYSTALQLTGDFTIEFWVNLVSKVTSFPCIVNNYSVYGANGGFAIFANHNSGTANKYNVALNGSFPVINSTDNITYNAWQHIALVRSGSGSNNITLYVNGFANGTTTSTVTITGTSNNWWIGSAGDTLANSYINGYISNFRIVKGTAVYTGNFTPPTAPITDAGSTSAASYPSTTNVNTSFASSATSLLLNFTNAGVYDATSKNDLETVGNAQISTAISAKWGSGSMSFDGTGDYFNLSNSTLYQFGTGDFAIEGWIYINSLSANCVLIDFRPINTATYGQIYITTGGVLRFYLPTDIGTSNSFSTGAWTFFAIARTAGTLNMYIGANRGYTGTYTSAMDSAALIIKVGADINGGNGLNGYLQDLRFTKGYGRGYTGATITVPTAAFPTL